jgi:hypothetical protein
MSGIRTNLNVVPALAPFLLLILVQTLAPFPAFALDIDFTVPDSQPKKSAKHVSPTDVYVDLDLSSPREVVPAQLAFDAENYAKPTVVVPEGENLRTVSKNCMLTASEYFALRQLMETGEQKMRLRDNGTASGGTFELDKFTADHCRNLYIPRHTTVIQNSAVLPTLNIPGEVHIAGLYEIRGNVPSIKSHLHAKRILLYPSGSIGSTSSDSISMKADKIETKVLADNISHTPKAASTGAYELKKVETTLVKADDEFIPAEGTEVSVEVGVLHQERESCQPKQ